MRAREKFPSRISLNAKRVEEEMDIRGRERRGDESEKEIAGERRKEEREGRGGEGEERLCLFSLFLLSVMEREIGERGYVDRKIENFRGGGDEFSSALRLSAGGGGEEFSSPLSPA